MTDDQFYKALFAPLEAQVGALDPETITPIVGFDAGGPVSLVTVGRACGEEFVTYITCELAVRPDQQPSTSGRYELALTCNNADWASELLTNIAHMTLEVAFGHGHTLDVKPWLGRRSPVQGLAFEGLSQSTIEGEPYSVLRLHGLSRHELKQAYQGGVEAVLAQRHSQGLYPRTVIPT